MRETLSWVQIYKDITNYSCFLYNLHRFSC